MDQASDERIRRAIVALGLTLLFGLLVLGLAAGATSVEPVVRIVGIAGAVLLLVVLGVELAGLLRRLPWAVAVVTPILVMLLVVGALVFVETLAHQALNLPIVPLICLWALWPRRPTGAAASSMPSVLNRSDRIRALAVAVATLVALAWPVISAGLLQPGGPLISAPTDFDASIEVGCREGTEPPATIDVTYRWSWRRAEPILGGQDQLTVSWSGFTNSEPDTPALLSDDASTGLSRSDMGVGPNGISVDYAIDLAVQRFETGSVRLSLARQPVGPGSHGSMSVEARYVRGSSGGAPGLWSAVPTRSDCTW